MCVCVCVCVCLCVCLCRQYCTVVLCGCVKRRRPIRCFMFTVACNTRIISLFAHTHTHRHIHTHAHTQDIESIRLCVVRFVCGWLCTAKHDFVDNEKAIVDLRFLLTLWCVRVTHTTRKHVSHTRIHTRTHTHTHTHSVQNGLEHVSALAQTAQATPTHPHTHTHTHSHPRPHNDRVGYA